MFSCFCKKKTRKENPPPINPTMEGWIHGAMKVQQAHQTTAVGHVDPANPQGQTLGNSIIAGPSAPADPAQVSSSPSTSSTFVIGVDPANPQGQTPGNSIIAGSSAPADPANPQGQTTGNSIIAGPSAPADPAQVSSSPSTSSTSVIGVDPANPQDQTPGNWIIAGSSAPADPARVSSTPTSLISVIGVDPAIPQGQTPGNSIIAGPSAPADSAEVSSTLSTSSTSAQALPEAGGRSRISSSISIGQDQAFDEVCKFLTEDDVGIVGIYGMGGVGKTTLTKKVWYEFLGPNNFKVLSIVVSKIVNVDRIQEDIMKKMDLPFEKDADKRAWEINKTIASSRRKLALLFDDIWEALDLYEIGVKGEMSFDTSIFKLIFTTRLEDVCSQMAPDREIKIQPLGWDDSWALFSKNVGTKTLNSFHNEILDLAKSVAEECGGLPLALIVIGRAMTCKYSRGAWEDALNNLRKSPVKVQGSEERLFSILKLTYDNIQNDVEKECFLFCCLYPEDYRIDPEELVEFWIGDGILDLDGSYHDTRNRGYAIIDRLSAACLLELKDEDCLTMHDIVRDMGLWIASESKFFVHGERLKLTQDEIRNKWEEANGMYVLKGDYLPEQPHCRNLTTLIFRTRELELQNSFFQFMDKLRILKIDGLAFLDTTFEIVGQFTELRWLCICNTNLEKFPSELGNLRKLNVLEIDFEEHLLDSIPPAIGQLRELRKLLIFGDLSIKMLPLELGKLSKLEELFLRKSYLNLIPNGVFEHMSELRRLELSVTSVGILPADLWNLCKLEHLHIKGEDMYHGMDKCPPWLNLDSVGVSIDGLKQLSKSLRTLVMTTWPIYKWADIGSALETMNEMSQLSIERFPVDEIIVTSKRLEKLLIGECRRLVNFQVGGDALKCLCFLSIHTCDSLKHIIGLEHLEHLEILRIIHCPKLEGELMNPNEGIRSLQELWLYDLPQVTTICSDHVSFPSLLLLDVFQCEKLEKFPRGLMNEKRPLQCEISGRKEWWEGLQWQDEDFKSYLLPFFRDLSVPVKWCGEL